jgi:hypothetical protein
MDEGANMWISIGNCDDPCGIHITTTFWTNQNEHSQIGHWIIWLVNMYVIGLVD